MSLLCLICPDCGGTAYLPKDEYPGDFTSLLAHHFEQPMLLPAHYPAPEGVEYDLCDTLSTIKCQGSGKEAILGMFKPKPKK